MLHLEVKARPEIVTRTQFEPNFHQIPIATTQKWGIDVWLEEPRPAVTYPRTDSAARPVE